MSKPYESIPRQGEHQGEIDEESSGMNVRAQDPPDLSVPLGKPAKRTFQLTCHRDKRHYRLRSWTTTEITSPEDEYEEIGRYTTENDLAAAFEELPQERRWVVFENSETGEVHFDVEQNISSGWTGLGEFDQVTLFDNETDAAAYAQKRQEVLNNSRTH